MFNFIINMYFETGRDRDSGVGLYVLRYRAWKSKKRGLSYCDAVSPITWFG